MMCRTGCKTRDHASWGECARSAHLNISTDLTGAKGHRAWDGELAAYADARRQGIQPKGTRQKQVDAATVFADRTGVGDPFSGGA